MTPSIAAEYRASKSISISVLISLVVIYISPSCGDLTVGPSIDHSYSLAASMFSSVSTFGIAIMSCTVLDSRRRFFTLFRLSIQSWIFLSSSSVLDFLICFPFAVRAGCPDRPTRPGRLRPRESATAQTEAGRRRNGKGEAGQGLGRGHWDTSCEISGLRVLFAHYFSSVDVFESLEISFQTFKLTSPCNRSWSVDRATKFWLCA